MTGNSPSDGPKLDTPPTTEPSQKLATGDSSPPVSGASSQPSQSIGSEVATPAIPTVESLRDELQTLQKQLKQAIWAGSIGVAALSALGIGKLSDIESKARERVDSAVTKGVEYFDIISNAQSRINAAQWAGAIGYLEQAITLRPDDEFVFTNLVMSYASGAEIEPGLRLLESAEKSGLFIRRYATVWAHLNAARLYMLAGVQDGKYIKSAEYHFGKAERAASRMKGGETAFVLYSQGIFYLLTGADDKARTSYQLMLEMDPRTRKWPEGDRQEPWFQHLMKVRPKLQEELEALFDVK
jgi:tetratricopeptide (TPR) repeat protein